MSPSTQPLVLAMSELHFPGINSHVSDVWYVSLSLLNRSHDLLVEFNYRFRMPEESIPKDAAYQIINDELMLDGNPRLNLASFVTTWMEPECDKLIMASINKNYVDMDEYPVTTELQVYTTILFTFFFILIFN